VDHRGQRPYPARKQRQERVQREVSIDDRSIQRRSSSEHGERNDSPKQRRVVTRRSQHAVRPIGRRPDDDGGRLGLVLEQLAEVAVEPADVVGKPALAEHEDPWVGAVG